MENNEIKNNIFKFATKELSQDAFIAWLINSINYDDCELKKLAKDFLLRIIEDEKYKHWQDLIKEEKCNVNVEVQFYNIDILVKIKDDNGKFLMIIIEDKVDTLEHDDQIKRYKNELKGHLKQDEKINLDDENILTCYYKIYDEADIENKKVDKVYTREKIYELLSNYKDKINNEFFKDYFEYISAVRKCAESYENKDKCSPIISKRKYDIKYLKFFREIENELSNEINKFAEEYETPDEYYSIISKKGKISEEDKNGIILKSKIEKNNKEKIEYGIGSNSNRKNMVVWYTN